MMEGKTTFSRLDVTDSMVMMVLAPRNSETMIKIEKQASMIERSMMKAQNALENMLSVDINFQPLRFVSSQNFPNVFWGFEFSLVNRLLFAMNEYWRAASFNAEAKE